MKTPLMFLAVAVLASVGTVAFDTDDLAFQGYDAAKLVAKAGIDDATAVTYGTLLEDYPYAPFIAEVRTELASLDTLLVSLPEEQDGLPLRDPLILSNAPWVGPSGVMILGLLLALWLAVMPRTKVRSLAAITLVLGLTASAFGQGFVDMSGGEGAGGPMAGGESQAFAYFPWISVGVLALGVLLGLMPREKE
ncbi:MAG: hypothetical protein ACI9EF_000224 [Pseudohongiellaceae bacterium]|jgi:hypothetical protein